MAFVRPAIERMQGYVPGEQPQRGGYVKLNTNENPYPPSPSIAEAVAAEAGRLALYPEPSSRVLREAVADLYGCRPSQVMAANGSDEMLRIVCQACVREGDVVVSFRPTYTLYATLSDIQGGVHREIPWAEGFRLPELTGLADAKIVFVPNPNAPSGTLLGDGDIARLCRATAGLVVIDEAYADFAGTTAIGLLDAHPNLVVTRTLSKSYSLAGLRVGFGFASEALLDELAKVRDSYNLDRLAQAAATAAIRDQAHMRANTAKVVDTRDRLSIALEELDAHVYPSAANFVLARFRPNEARTLYERLKARKILVRYFAHSGLEDCLRITVGTDSEIDALLVALRQELHGLR